MNSVENFRDELQKRILALSSVIWIHSTEENRAYLEIIKAIEDMRERPKYSQPTSYFFGYWTITSGLNVWSNPTATDALGLASSSGKPDYLNTNETTRIAEIAVRWIETFRHGDIVVVFKDLHQILKDPGACRALKDFIAYQEFQNLEHPPTKTIIITSPTLDIPIELENDVCVIDLALPNEKDLRERLDLMITTAETEQQSSGISDESKSDIVKASKGLTMRSFDDAIMMSAVEERPFDIQKIHEQKKQIVIKDGTLEILDPIPMNEVGGLNRLKDWLNERSAGFTEAGREYGITPPKGLMLLGVQGCGKSLVSKAIAHLLKLSLYKLDIGKLFGGHVGASESKTRNVLKRIEAVAPAVLLIDEIDKGMSGVHSSSYSDAGTTSRVIGTLLSWMNDHQSGMFLVATCNSVHGLPPELLRKGRFDEIFFVNLPTKRERIETFRIHIERIHRNPNDYDLDLLAEMTPRFSGAEIEAIIKDALIKSFATKKLTQFHIEKAIQHSVPLWETRKEELTGLINWVGLDENKKDGIKARFANSAEEEEAGGDNVVALHQKAEEH